MHQIYRQQWELGEVDDHLKLDYNCKIWYYSSWVNNGYMLTCKVKLYINILVITYQKK